tara:strand:+ start:161 stop:295 length:135 start_codon:yes stop_codon:yes gene_type:complete
MKALSVILLIGATSNYEAVKIGLQFEQQFASLMLILSPRKNWLR